MQTTHGMLVQQTAGCHRRCSAPSLHYPEMGKRGIASCGPLSGAAQVNRSFYTARFSTEFYNIMPSYRRPPPREHSTDCCEGIPIIWLQQVKHLSRLVSTNPQHITATGTQSPSRGLTHCPAHQPARAQRNSSLVVAILFCKRQQLKNTYFHSITSSEILKCQDFIFEKDSYILINFCFTFYVVITTGILLF